MTTITRSALGEIPLTTIDEEPTSLAAYDGRAVLIVNVASRCGLTPQYEQLEQLQRDYGDRGLTVLGFPCNQFMGQEPGSDDEIKEFCSMTYGVTFPLMAKTRVNGSHAHPLYKVLKKAKDSHGLGGPVMWNFEKFLLAPDGTVTRFRPQTRPDDPAVIAAVESAIAAV